MHRRGDVVVALSREVLLLHEGVPLRQEGLLVDAWGQQAGRFLTDKAQLLWLTRGSSDVTILVDGPVLGIAGRLVEAEALGELSLRALLELRCQRVVKPLIHSQIWHIVN